MEEIREIDPKVEYLFLYEYFERMCPEYISIGMSYDEFWSGDPVMAISYRKAYEIRIKQQMQMIDWTNYNQGVYNYEALCCVSPVLHAFAKKGTKPLPYPTKPHGLKIDESKEKTEEEKEKEEEQERLRAKVFFSNWARSVGKKFKDGK